MENRGINEGQGPMEQTLTLSNEMYRTLLDSQPNAIFLHKLLPEGFASFSEVNRFAIEHYGYSRDEFLQLSPADITTREGVEKTSCADSRQQLAKDRHLEFEVVHIKKSGEEFPVQISATIISLNGEDFILATVVDISERKKREVERQLNTDRVMTILNSIDADVYVADMESHEILFMNEHMVRSFGHDLTGKICWDVFRKEQGPCSVCTNDFLVDQGGQPNGLHVWQDQNPVTLKEYINYDRAIPWTDGRQVKLQIAMDITEMKSMEKQLRQKFKMEAVGVMAGGIAHDFNNKLAIILGNVELSQMKLSGRNDVAGHLEDAKTAIMRARDLVQQILTYSRQGDQEFKPLKLALIIKESMKLMRSTIPTSVKIEVQIDDDQLTASADATQVQEILINLCNNAVFAMEGEGALAIRLSRSDVDLKDIPAQFSAVPGDYAKISVIDSGCGISTEHQEKIFDPFFTTKGIGEGTGMGLAVVQGILESHRGFASVQSSDKGTRFDIHFPLVHDLVQEQKGENATRIHGDETILFVDDEEMLVNIGREILSAHGYQVFTETSSVKALELYRQDPKRFDLVMTDQTMPELSGKGFTAELLKINPAQRIVLCTGFSDQVDDEDIQSLGVKEFCMKPFDMVKLVQTVRKVLDQ